MTVDAAWRIKAENASSELPAGAGCGDGSTNLYVIPQVETGMWADRTLDFLLFLFFLGTGPVFRVMYHHHCLIGEMNETQLS